MEQLTIGRRPGGKKFNFFQATAKMLKELGLVGSLAPMAKEVFAKKEKVNLGRGGTKSNILKCRHDIYLRNYTGCFEASRHKSLHKTTSETQDN